MTKAKLQTTDILKSKEEPTISQSELDTLKAQAAKVEDLEKAVAKTADLETQVADLEKANARIADLEKSAKKLEDLEKAAQVKVLLDTTDVVKGFNLFAEDNIEDVAKFLVANAGAPAVNLILESLEKARTAIKEFGESEHGTDLEGKTADTSKADTEALGVNVMDIIKNRNKQA